jgi:hypothetical protein
MMIGGVLMLGYFLAIILTHRHRVETELKRFLLPMCTSSAKYD